MSQDPTKLAPRERLLEIVRLRHGGLSLQEIGKRFGLTKEGVRKILIKARAEGIDVGKQTLNGRALVRLFGVEWLTIRRGLDSLGIQASPSGQYRIDTAQTAKLTEYLVRHCVMCGVGIKLGQDKVCSACRPDWKHNGFVRVCEQQPHEDNTLPGKVPRLALMALKHVAPDDRQLLSFGEAVLLSGLTKMQLRWLFLRGIIDTKNHPTDLHFRTRRPVKLYYSNQMAAIAGIVAGV